MASLTESERKTLMLRGALNDLGSNCKRCSLGREDCVRQNIVFGGGNPDAPIMLVTGTVGWKEDMTGNVLAGEPGALVAYAMSRVGLDPMRDIYVATVLKCQRPHVERDGKRERAEATPEQVAACSPYLRWQMAAVNPVIVVAQGRIAGQVVLGERRPLVKYGGGWRSFGKNRIAAATHNPAGLMFGDRIKLQAEYLDLWDNLAERLSCLGRLWKPTAACFEAGWQYSGVIAA